jgi:ubiquinol-cytochrome c reductase subunit 6
MGGGFVSSFVHFITPGTTSYDNSLSPHIATPSYVKQMLKEGENPKPLLIEECKPQCKYWKAKLERCEAQLEKIIKINPTKTCMYPMRDYVTCIEACVQPIIHNNLVGTEH